MKFLVVLWLMLAGTIGLGYEAMSGSRGQHEVKLRGGTGETASGTTGGAVTLIAGQGGSSASGSTSVGGSLTLAEGQGGSSAWSDSSPAIGNRINSAVISADGSMFFSTGGAQRLWLDHDGVLHYNGSEVATRADVEHLRNEARWRTSINGINGGIVGFVFANFLFVMVRWQRIKFLLAWRKRRRERNNNGPFRSGQ